MEQSDELKDSTTRVTAGRWKAIQGKLVALLEVQSPLAVAPPSDIPDRGREGLT